MKIALLLLCPLLSFSQIKYPYKNLALEGGGVRGLAYPGALEVLEQKNIIVNIENVAGSSAGAIAGLMISLGYNSHEIDSILQTLKIQQFNDGKNIIGKIKRVKNKYGVFKGMKFENWLAHIIYKKTGDSNTTFIQLHNLHLANNKFKDLYCTATNITQQRLDILSWKKYPLMKLKTAVHISSCIPFYFEAVAADSLGNEVSDKDTSVQFNLYVDGGMLCNYPINMFDSSATGGNIFSDENIIYNNQTLGLKLEREDQVKQFDNGKTDIAPYTIKNMKEYTSAVMNLMMEKLNRETIDLSNEKGRTIYISYGDISGRVRKISAKEKKILHNNGVVAAQKFFNNTDISTK